MRLSVAGVRRGGLWRGTEASLRERWQAGVSVDERRVERRRRMMGSHERWSRGAGCCLLLLSIYNPAVKYISNSVCVCVFAASQPDKLQGSTPAAMTTPRPLIWTQTMPPETTGAMATGSSTPPPSLFFYLLLIYHASISQKLLIFRVISRQTTPQKQQHKLCPCSYTGLPLMNIVFKKVMSK